MGPLSPGRLIIPALQIVVGDYVDMEKVRDLVKLLAWWHYFQNTWIADTPHNADEFTKRLYPHLNKTDRLLVIEIDPNNSQGWLPEEAWNWLLQRRVPRLPSLPPPPFR